VWPTDESAPTKTRPCERRQHQARPIPVSLPGSGLKLPTNRQQLFHQGYAGSGLSAYDCSDVVDSWFRSQRQSIERPRPMLLQSLHELRKPRAWSDKMVLSISSAAFRCASASMRNPSSCSKSALLLYDTIHGIGIRPPWRKRGSLALLLIWSQGFSQIARKMSSNSAYRLLWETKLSHVLMKSRWPARLDLLYGACMISMHERVQAIREQKVRASAHSFKQVLRSSDHS
jgi:hypothetical protein